jgi:hypothetical protein
MKRKRIKEKRRNYKPKQGRSSCEYFVSLLSFHPNFPSSYSHPIKIIGLFPQKQTNKRKHSNGNEKEGNINNIY